MVISNQWDIKPMGFQRCFLEFQVAPTFSGTLGFQVFLNFQEAQMGASETWCIPQRHFNRDNDDNPWEFRDVSFFFQIEPDNRQCFILGSDNHSRSGTFSSLLIFLGMGMGVSEIGIYSQNVRILWTSLVETIKSGASFRRFLVPKRRFPFYPHDIAIRFIRCLVSIRHDKPSHPHPKGAIRLDHALCRRCDVFPSRRDGIVGSPNGDDSVAWPKVAEGPRWGTIG